VLSIAALVASMRFARRGAHAGHCVSQSRVHGTFGFRGTRLCAYIRVLVSAMWVEGPTMLNLTFSSPPQPSFGVRFEFRGGCEVIVRVTFCLCIVRSI
jgi:hypothetical protein